MNIIRKIQSHLSCTFVVLFEVEQKVRMKVSSELKVKIENFPESKNYT